jgi:hypothetical protein
MDTNGSGDSHRRIGILITRAAITAEIALHREEKPMEEILREPEYEPEELTESELGEIAGGNGCCGCCGPSVSLELELSLCL